MTASVKLKMTMKYVNEWKRNSKKGKFLNEKQYDDR